MVLAAGKFKIKAPADLVSDDSWFIDSKRLFAVLSHGAKGQGSLGLH